MEQMPWFWIIGGILSVITVVGNCGVIILITTRKLLRTTRNWFVLSLAVADFSFGALFLPLGRLITSTPDTHSIIGSQIVFVLGAASVTNLCIMTLDRYIAIVHPLRYVTFMTPTRVGLLISGAWLMALIRPSFHLEQMSVVKNGTRGALALRSLDSVLYQIIPCIALLLATVHILLIVRRHSKQTAAILTQLRHNYSLRSQDENPTSEENAESSRTQEAIAAKMVLAVVVVFILCYSLGAARQLSRENNPKETVLERLFHILIIINSAVNPFAYALFKTDIKREMRICFCCFKDNQAPPS